jgi:broad specificity phosphatase PhoE
VLVPGAAHSTDDTTPRNDTPPRQADFAANPLQQADSRQSAPSCLFSRHRRPQQPPKQLPAATDSLHTLAVAAQNRRFRLVPVPASLIHLVRHGEVFNPDGVLYGRIPGFGLSELGTRMAQEAADSKVGHPITRLYASPLQRTQESAAPWSRAFGKGGEILPIMTENRLIEPWNNFEGTKGFGSKVLRNPKYWPMLRNPFKPSWGEPYAEIAKRMLAAIEDAWAATDDGEVVLVSHQLPIWMVHRKLAGERLFHDPRQRRCALSSITTLTRDAKSANGFVEVDYQDPAAALQASAVDSGAV